MLRLIVLNAAVVKVSVCFPDLPLAPEPHQLLQVASLRAVPSAEQVAERTGQSEEHFQKSEAGVRITPTSLSANILISEKSTSPLWFIRKWMQSFAHTARLIF